MSYNTRNKRNNQPGASSEMPLGREGMPAGGCGVALASVAGSLVFPEADKA